MQYSVKKFLHDAIFCKASPTAYSILDNKFQIVQSSETENSGVLCKRSSAKWISIFKESCVTEILYRKSGMIQDTVKNIWHGTVICESVLTRCSILWRKPIWCSILCRKSHMMQHFEKEALHDIVICQRLPSRCSISERSPASHSICKGSPAWWQIL
jgi:hypothetical protein